MHKHGYDIYGQKIDNGDANGEVVECTLCRKHVGAAKFAPHLEKCMGLGRAGRIKRGARPGDVSVSQESRASAEGSHVQTEESDEAAGDLADDHAYEPKSKTRGAQSPGKRSRTAVGSRPLAKPRPSKKTQSPLKHESVLKHEGPPLGNESKALPLPDVE